MTTAVNLGADWSDGICDAKSTHCPICAGAIAPWKTKSTSWGDFQIETCRGCGYGFVNPRPSCDYLMKFYESSGDAHGAPAARVESANAVLEAEALDPNATIDAQRMLKTVRKFLRDDTQRANVLDVGCGYGLFSREARRAGLVPYGLELAANARSIAKEIAGIDAQAVSFEEYSAQPGMFAVILMSQILEHAHDVNLWLSKANRLLSEGGILAVALPNFDSLFRRILQEREPFICPPAHLNFFSPRSLGALLQKHGFEVLETQWISRIPPAAFEKRLPSALKAGMPVINAGSRLLLKGFDSLHLGQIINVYARKARAIPLLNQLAQCV